jgi:polyisoprenoid-binding protein YceI
MSNNRLMTIIGALVMLGIGALVGVFGYITVVGGSGQASATISAPTLSMETATPGSSVLETQIAELQAAGGASSTQVAALSAQVEGLQGENATLVALNTSLEAQAEAALSVTEAAPAPTATALPPTATPVPSIATVAPTEVTAAADIRLFRIVSEESEVTFTLTEDLRGVFTTVVGVTNQVAGDILVDVSQPAGSRMGELRINARTLTTDNEFRNRAMRSEILESSRPEYEFISFTPTALDGLPASVTVGEAITFTVTGDLTIRTITQSVTFEVTATLVSDDRLEGSATTTVTRTQYDLQIPSVPGVTNVSDEVELAIQFVAARVEQ